MSVHELNQLMTYVVEGWMLFSAGFISTTFVAFVSKRIQEDIAAAELAQAEVQVDSTEQTDVEEAARLQEVTAVSEKLAKEKEQQQPDTSSVSVST